MSFEFDREDRDEREATCKHCGARNVYWQTNQQTGKWELRNFSATGVSGTLHRCPEEDREEHVVNMFD